MWHRKLQRRITPLALLPLGVFLIALAYMVGMSWLEESPRDFWQSLAWAAETLTTTGYGHDNQWRNPFMITFVVAVQFVGVFLVFLVFPIFIIPFFVRDIASEVPIIARVNRAENVSRIRAAGADFALSIGQVAGQLLSARLFGEEFVALEPEMRIAKVPAKGLEELTPTRARVRQRTGCSIVAVEREDELLVEFGPDFTFLPGDSLYLCGSGEAVTRYLELYPEARRATDE